MKKYRKGQKIEHFFRAMLASLFHIMALKEDLYYLFDTLGQMDEDALGQRQLTEDFLCPKPQAAFPRAVRISNVPAYL